MLEVVVDSDNDGGSTKTNIDISHPLDNGTISMWNDASYELENKRNKKEMIN